MVKIYRTRVVMLAGVVVVLVLAAVLGSWACPAHTQVRVDVGALGWAVRLDKDAWGWGAWKAQLDVTWDGASVLFLD